jgi:hypothetical protein
MFLPADHPLSARPLGELAWNQVSIEDRQKLILGVGVIAAGVGIGRAVGESIREGKWMDEAREEPTTGGEVLTWMVGAGLGTAMFAGMVDSALKEYGWKNIALYMAGLSGFVLVARAARGAFER